LDERHDPFRAGTVEHPGLPGLLILLAVVSVRPVVCGQSYFFQLLKRSASDASVQSGPPREFCRCDQLPSGKDLEHRLACAWHGIQSDLLDDAGNFRLGQLKCIERPS